MRARPSSASSARGSTSLSRVIHCERPASRSSPAEREERPFARPGQQELFNAEDFALQKDLFGHPIKTKPLRIPHFITRGMGDGGWEMEKVRGWRGAHHYCLMRLLLIFLLALSGVWGQSRTAKPAAPRAAKGPAPDAAGDTRIEKDIRARFAKSKISRNNFQVRVQGGVAIIEGQTDVIQHKGVATRLAKTGGATAVVNRIQVSQAARDKAAHNLAEGRRRAQVKRTAPRDTR